MSGEDDASLPLVLAGRERLLSRLSADAATKEELTEDFETSRSTIDRGITELRELDLIERDGEAYRTTLAGELALEEFDRFVGRIDGIVDAQALLETLPADARFDPSLFDGAEVVVPDRFDQERAVGSFERRLAGTERIRAVDAGWGPSLIEACRSAAEDGTEVELAVTGGVLDRLLADHREAISAALSTGSFDLRTADDPLPYTLSVLRTSTGTVATVGITDADGRPAGTIVTSGREAVDWARTTLEDVWSEASSLTLGGE